MHGKLGQASAAPKTVASTGVPCETLLAEWHDRVWAMTDAMNQPNFRTAGTQMRLAEAIYRGMFEGAPHPYLILAPTLRIAGGNEAYMAATLRRRDALVGFDMFDAFPDNPLDDQATGVRNLGASFERALAHVRRDAMELQRYDIRRPDGVWEVRYWSPVNWPIVDEAGSVIAIVHHVTDVTERVLEPRPQRESLLFRAERACLEAQALVRESEANLRLAHASARSPARGSRE